jgi:hypothetical protein
VSANFRLFDVERLRTGEVRVEHGGRLFDWLFDWLFSIGGDYG